MPEDPGPERSPETPPPRLHIRALPETYGSAPEEPPPAREGLLGVRPDELRRTAILTGYLFAASCVFVLGRTVRDAFFLSFYGERVGRLLPYMFIAYGVASALVAVFYARVASSARRDRFVIGFSAVAGASYLLVRLLVHANPPWLYGLFYVWAEIVGNLTLAQFWSVANDLHDARSAKRLFGIIGVGRTVGVLACGLGAGSFVENIGTENLLFVLAALMGGIAALVAYLSREYRLGGPGTTPQPRPGPSAFAASLRLPYVRSLALMMLLGFVVVNIGDFQFKAAARLAYPDRDRLAHFMALFYATLGAIALFLQIVGTRWTLRRFGVAGGMLALPLAYLLANVGLLMVPSLELATAVKIADNAFQFTIFDATLQLLYFPLPTHTKEGVRSFLEAVAKPLGYTLAGLAVLAMRAWWQPTTLPAIAAQSWFVLPLTLAWIAMIPRVRAHYLQTLERSLTRREANATPSAVLVHDANTRDALLRALRGTSPRAAVFALEQLVTIDPDTARDALPTALGSEHKALRIAALRATATLHAREALATLGAALEDPDDEVAATAASAYGELAGEDCQPLLQQYTEINRPKVQDAVLTALLRHGGLEGMLAAGRVVEAWLSSADPAQRARAAALFACPGIPGLRRVVRRLLEDPDPHVRRAALAAAGAVGDASTADAVLAAMRDPASEVAAARALAQIGPRAIAAVDRALRDPSSPRHVRLALPRVLAQMRAPEAYHALLGHLDEPDEWVRQKVLASASRARAAGGFEALAEREARPRMLREIEGVARLRESYARARAFLAIPLLDRWVVERLRKGLVRVLRLGELAHPRTQVAAARDALFDTDAAKRARAVEMLENLLDLPVRARFVAELDALVALRASPLPAPRIASEGAEDAFVRWLVALPEPFARIMALDASQFRGVRLPDEVVVELTRDDDPAVREMAALVVATYQFDNWREILGRMRSDEDERVRTYAEYAYTTGRTGMDPGDEMYTTLEKVLFLQRIPLFEDVPPEHLVELARSAEVEHRPAGTTVFRAGDPGDALFFVIDGKVCALAEGRAPVELGEGEVFGEMSVLDSAPRSVAVKVVEDATLLRIAQEDFYDVLHEATELAEGVIRVLVRRLRTTSIGG